MKRMDWQWDMLVVAQAFEAYIEVAQTFEAYTVVEVQVLGQELAHTVQDQVQELEQDMVVELELDMVEEQVQVLAENRRVSIGNCSQIRQKILLVFDLMELEQVQDMVEELDMGMVVALVVEQGYN